MPIVTLLYSLVDHLSKQWMPGKAKNPEPRVFTIQQNSAAFSKKFDAIQEQLETLASMDDLLSGAGIITLTLLTSCYE